MITALLLAFMLQAPAAVHVPLLNAEEQARLTVADQQRLSPCAPLEQRWIDNHYIERLKCADGVYRLDVPTGTVTKETRHQRVSAKLKSWGLYAAGAAITVIYIYAGGAR